VKNYDQAETIIMVAGKGYRNPYFQAQLLIFPGIIQEKKYHDNEKAQQ